MMNWPVDSMDETAEVKANAGDSEGQAARIVNPDAARPPVTMHSLVRLIQCEEIANRRVYRRRWLSESDEGFAPQR
jgi:hypothetical protein